MKKILVVDDEPDIVQLICRYAEFEGYTADTAADGCRAVELCKTNQYSAIVLDIMMPEMDGYTACKKIRTETSQNKDTPIILLSALGTEYDKLMGFELGIDDYVVKPFSPKELMARIKVRTTRRGTSSNERLQAGKIEIDKPGRAVQVDGNKVELTAKEYDLLVFLAENSGVVLSRGKILDAVWGYDYIGDGRTVDWQIKLLRNHLGPCRQYIVTIRGVGYKFEVCE